MFKSKLLKRALLAFIILLLMLVSFGCGMYFTSRSETLQKVVDYEALYAGQVLDKYSLARPGVFSQDIKFDLFWDVWDALKTNYVDEDKLNEKKMFYGALRGLVASIGDPYTVFMDPKIAKEFDDDLAGTFEGIGAEIGIKNDILTIIAPLPDMPAEIAGLKAGDKVYAINGESTTGIHIDEAVNKIRGPRGTEVILTISRNGLDQVQDITIKRGAIIVKSIRANLRDDNIFVVKITNFNDDTAGLFNKAAREIIEANPDGVILDLRNNPGGYLDTAIEIASEWIEEGTVVAEKYSEERKNEHLSRGRARLKNYATVVLVNEGSASASEIVSGALQDYGLAKVVGKKTFGKGSVQTLTNLKDGSSIKITVAKWLTPNGRSINDEGIEPDEIIDLTLEDYNANLDPQMDAAAAILNGIYVRAATSTEETVGSSTEEIKK